MVTAAEELAGEAGAEVSSAEGGQKDVSVKEGHKRKVILRRPKTLRSGKTYAPKWSGVSTGVEAEDNLGLQQHWTGIGLDRSNHHGKFTLTDVGEMLVRATRDPADHSGLINLNRTRTIFNYVIGGTAIGQAASMKLSSDWRGLGVRIALYDDLRERRFTQTTGVDWAIAKREPIRTDYVPTKRGHEWGFQAVVVNWRYIDKYLQGNGKLPVGLQQEDDWDLRSDDVVVIGLSQNTADASYGMEAWILAHLDYPLVFGLDEFNIKRIGIENFEPRRFVRTSSLVRVPGRARKVVYVLFTDTMTHADIGGLESEVPILNRFGRLDGVTV